MREPRDFSLAMEIYLAERDGRECPWYAVYNRVLRDYIFMNPDGEQCICTVIPQYSLVAEYDAGHSAETDKIEVEPRPVYNARLFLQSPAKPTLPRPHSDVHMSSPGVHQDSTVQPSARTPFNPTHRDADSPLSFIVASGPTPTGGCLNDHTAPLQPRTPVSSRHWDTDSPLSPLSSGGSPFVLRSYASRTLPLPISPTLAVHRKTEEFRRSDRLKSRPALPVQCLSSEIPITPPKVNKVASTKSTRIPDFIGALFTLPAPRPLTTEFPKQFSITEFGDVIMRTILIVEIKSEQRSLDNNWERVWERQVKDQARHAFHFHTDLDRLGVIMAFGRRWIYINVKRPLPDGLTESQRRDLDYIPSPQSDWQDTSSDIFMDVGQDLPRNLEDRHVTLPNEEDSTNSDMEMIAPRFLSSQYELPPGRPYLESYLLQPDGRSELFLEKISEDLQELNNDIWK